MMTPKELMLEFLKPDGKPDRQLIQYEGLCMALGDPVQRYLNEKRLRGTTSIDRWGVTIRFDEDAPGPTPIIDDETKVLKDITHWRDYVTAPDIAAHCSEGWEEFSESVHKNAGDRLIAGFMGTGIFEEVHFLMGFEDALRELYEHPQEMHELIDYITDYRIQYAKMLIDGIQPDVIFNHDDWGAREALFMKPEMWREFFKEPARRFYQYVRSRGVIAIHHADSYLVPIVDDMAEIGIQVWQGVLPENDIPALQKHLKGKMALMGGIGAVVDAPGKTEEEIRSYVRNALYTYCPGGHFIPSITYGMFGTINPLADQYINDEIEKYNRELHIPSVSLPDVPRRKKKAALHTETAAGQTKTADTLSLLATAMRRAQKKRSIDLTKKALEEGIDAQTILSDGLVRGMNLLGDDFSAGRAFVPEMLMAAKCMTLATELLTPHLSGESSESKGKVVIGTMKGDLHDIGKNLVKIMMEGIGLDVIDLGVDVPAERFVQTAIDEKCDIIACSSLLTTSMHEMRNVVELCEQKGIRDQIRIQIGGAPVSQNFCVEIGADAYTPDASSAARKAVELLASC